MTSINDSNFAIHILGEIGKTPAKCTRLLQGDQDEIKFRAEETVGNEEGEMILNSVTDYEEVDMHKEQSQLVNIPFDVLEKIMKFCFGVEYLKFRATCKTCHLAAPMIGWNLSPWLMVLDDKHPGLVTFTNPISGDTYYRKTPRQLTGDLRIHYSRYGWLLMSQVKKPNDHRPMLFNPFTSDVIKLPKVPSLESFCFTAPPTSPDCMVVGFHKSSSQWRVYILAVARETFWRILFLDLHLTHGPLFLSFPIYSDPDIYVLSNGGRLVIIGEIGDEEEHYHGYRSGIYFAAQPRSCCQSSTKNYLVERDQDILQVIVGEYGESVEVFKFNGLKEEWEKIDGLGRHVIFICDVTCVCIEAKMQEMENKIYFPRLHSENGKIVFYSFETSMYHTSSDVNMMDFVGTKQHLCPHAWIQPNW